MRLNPSILDEMMAAFAIGLCIAASPIARLWYRRWGIRPSEEPRALPGDSRVSSPNLTATRAIRIHASPAAVWPWLIQMGQGRGGLYTYQRLENLVGCDMRNADEILPEHQTLLLGDRVRLAAGEDAPQFEVAEIESEQFVVLWGAEPATTWTFALDAVNDGTRLWVRWRQDIPPGFANFLVWRVFVDPITFVMERRMLKGIKARAES